MVIADANIGAKVASACDVLTVQSTKKRGRIVFAPDEERPTVRLDIGKLEQFVINLVINALDAVTERPEEIRLREDSATPGVGWPRGRR